MDFGDFYSLMMECIEGFHYEKRLVNWKWNHFCSIDRYKVGFKHQDLVDAHVYTHFILVEEGNSINGYP